MKSSLFACMLIAFFASQGHAADAVVVARVNGTPITANELEAAVDRLIPRATYHGNVSEDKRNEFREKALEDLIIQELQHQDAVERGIKPEKKQVKAELSRIRDHYKSAKEYKRALEQSGLTEDTLRDLVEKQLLVQAAIVKTVVEPAQSTEEELKEYYSKNIAKFKQPESVKVRILTCKDEARAREAMSRIKAGEDFGDVAASLSEDDYRVKGGDVGYIHRGRILQEIEDAAFQMKPGETSDIIKAEGLWFIVKVEDRKPEQMMSYAESKEKLKTDLGKKRSEELLGNWISRLKAKAKIEILLNTQDKEPAEAQQK
jgi:parvulin-like peptidyl-prolyl isomerase